MPLPHHPPNEVFGPPSGYTSFEDAYLHEPIIQCILRNGGSMEDVAVALAGERNAIIKRLETLESIAPKKTQLPDGTIMIWRCPDDLVPLSKQPIPDLSDDSDQSTEKPCASQLQPRTRKLQSIIIPDPTLHALLATIREEWNDVETWSTHAPHMPGMPQGEAFAQLLAALLAAETSTPRT